MHVPGHRARPRVRRHGARRRRRRRRHRDRHARWRSPRSSGADAATRARTPGRRCAGSSASTAATDSRLHGGLAPLVSVSRRSAFEVPAGLGVVEAASPSRWRSPCTRCGAAPNLLGAECDGARSRPDRARRAPGGRSPPVRTTTIVTEISDARRQGSGSARRDGGGRSRRSTIRAPSSATSPATASTSCSRRRPTTSHSAKASPRCGRGAPS